jgi:pantothenate kinase
MEKNLPGNAWERLSSLRLTLDQTKALVHVDRGEFEKFYYPLGSYLLDQITSKERLLAAIAGPPGSGKTAFGTILAKTITAMAGTEMAVCLGLDGWHFPNAYLDSHFVEHNGVKIPLRSIKGAPESYDVSAAYQCLGQIRTVERVSFPKYSRKLHDPVPDAGVIEVQHRIILAEGNYWLLNEQPWKDFQYLFDLTIFLSAPAQSLVAGLRKRHLRGAKSSKVVEEHIQNVDLVNIEHVLRNSVKADVVVNKLDSRWIEKIIFS